MIIDLFKGKIQNNRELFYNILGSVGIKGFAMFVNILTLPAYLNYFTDEKVLGVWFAILSILNWVLTFDLGIGNGLRNYLVGAIAEKDLKKIKKYISSAYITLSLISLFIGFLGFYLIGEVNWNKVLNISNQDLKNTILIFVIRLVFFAIIVQLIFKLVLSILYALQKTALSNSISLISNILILIFLLLYNSGNLVTNLKSVSFVYVLAINVPLLIATVFVFFKPLKASTPSFRYYDYNYSKKIVKLGTIFLLIQVTLLIINSSNQILISYLFSPEDVVIFQAYYRLFSIFLTFFSLLTIPIWSSVTKAYSENRIEWIKKIYFYLNVVAVLVGICSFMLIIPLQHIMDFWLGDNSFIVKNSTAITFSIYNTIMVLVYSSTCIANGISELKAQLYCNVTAAVLKIPLCIYLSQLFNDWVIIMIVNIIIMLPSVLIQPIALMRNLKKRLQYLSLSSL